MSEGERSHKIHEYLYHGYIVGSSAEKRKKEEKRVERSANAETSWHTL